MRDVGEIHKFCPRYYRPIGQPPEKKDDGTHSTVNETIDASVFDRWHRVPSYRPPNLSDWAQRNNVNIDTLDRAVRADASQIPAPE